MRNAELSELFLSGANKQLGVKFGGDSNTYGNGNVVQESFSLDERLTISNDTLRFGDCVVSECEFEFVPNGSYTSYDYVDDTVSITISPSASTSMQMLNGYVVEDEIIDNISNIRHIICRDKLGMVIGNDATEWYNSLSLPMTFGNIVNSFRTWLNAQTGLTIDTPTLTNISALSVDKKVSGTMCVSEILNAIGECTASFPHVVGSTLKWITLKTSGTDFNVEYYKSGKVGKKDTDKITCIYTRNASGQVASKYPSSDGANPYEVSNIFTYGMSAQTLGTLVTEIYNRVKDVAYRYVDIETIGNPCYEVGDRFTAEINGQNITTYMVGRRLKGLQGLMDNYDTPRKTKSSSINNVRSILQRQGAMTVELKADTQGLHATVTQEINSAVSTEASNRNSAISSAIDTESYNRNVAISNATTNKLDKTGGTQSFSWELTATEFRLLCNGTVVFRCNASGLNVVGDGTFTGTVGANGIRTGTIGATTVAELQAGRLRLYDSSGNLVGYLSDSGLSLNKADRTAQYWFHNDGIYLTDSPSGGGQSDLSLGSNSLSMTRSDSYGNYYKTFSVNQNGFTARNIKHGSATINSNSFTHISFPTEAGYQSAFPSTPHVVATYVNPNWANGLIGAIKINNVTTTGFDATISGDWSGNVDIDWIAIC